MKKGNPNPLKPRAKHPWRRNPWDGTAPKDPGKKFQAKLKEQNNENKR